ncbi:hypothetical protein HX882_04200 [Pseudomonas gingeri]|uniref:Uncharacterized protein n=1 Tax=Pseudomonas gingeri TaxID=117681 RepID=A0A7Y7X8A3_9PSED|nr:hypothetical protein [Pseudomonas gingeri]NWB95093.1 hypothetical protein [Pseudomonas gingeri]
MSDNQYEHLQGMGLVFVSGRLEDKPEIGAIGYSMTFRLLLDFERFKEVADAHIPGYLDAPINAIRPELAGLAYHHSYSYLSGAAGRIHSFEQLCRVFSNPDNYLSDWSANDFSRRYGKPVFEFFDDDVFITVGQDFRWHDRKRKIVIADLPIIEFQWALNLMLGHDLLSRAPTAVVVLGYFHEDKVKVGDAWLNRGILYMKGSDLHFGKLTASEIGTAQ